MRRPMRRRGGRPTCGHRWWAIAAVEGRRGRLPPDPPKPCTPRPGVRLDRRPSCPLPDVRLPDAPYPHLARRRLPLPILRWCRFRLRMHRRRPQAVASGDVPSSLPVSAASRSEPTSLASSDSLQHFLRNYPCCVLVGGLPARCKYAPLALAAAAACMRGRLPLWSTWLPPLATVQAQRLQRAAERHLARLRGHCWRTCMPTGYSAPRPRWPSPAPAPPTTRRRLAGRRADRRTEPPPAAALLSRLAACARCGCLRSTMDRQGTAVRRNRPALLDIPSSAAASGAATRAPSRFVEAAAVQGPHRGDGATW